MTGQSTVTGTVAAYAGGSIIATFVAQGGGSPTVTTVSANIASNGTFSLLAWDNTNALYAPSQTNFQIQVGESTFFNASTVVAGASEDISTIFAGAPAPPGGGGSFSSLAGGTNTSAAMVVGSGASLSVTGSGTNNANNVNGAVVPASAAYVATNSNRQLIAASAPGPTANQNIRAFTMHFNMSDGSVIAGTIIGAKRIEYAGTITGWYVYGDVSGNATIGVKSVPFASYTGLAGYSGYTDVVNGGTAPSLSSAVENSSTTLTSWLTSVAANSILCIQLSSPANCKTLDLVLQIAAS